MNVNSPETALIASPFAEGERIEVRGFSTNGAARRNPHPTLSFEKGEATETRDAFWPEVPLKVLRQIGRASCRERV